MITPNIDFITKQEISVEWCALRLQERTLINVIQSRITKECIGEIENYLGQDLNKDDYSTLRLKIDQLNGVIDHIEYHFPWQSAGTGIKTSYSRAIKQSRNALSLLEQKVNVVEENHFNFESKSPVRERLDQALTRIESIVNQISTKTNQITPTIDQTQYEFGNLWMGNFTWLKNLCGYQNRHYDTERFRRDSLIRGVRRIGKHQVLIEYLDWLTKVNEANSLMSGAIRRWKEDRDWLIDRFD